MATILSASGRLLAYEPATALEPWTSTPPPPDPPPSTLPAAVYDFRPANMTASGWSNGGTAGTAHNLVLRSGNEGIVLQAGGPNGSRALRLPADVWYGTDLNMPISGRQPRTTLLIARLAGEETSGLLGYGMAQVGKAHDLIAYQGAVQLHPYGNQVVVKLLTVNQWQAFFIREKPSPTTAGWLVRASRAETDFPFDTIPVDTSSGVYQLGRGHTFSRKFQMDVAELREWNSYLSDADVSLLAQYVTNQYGLTI